MTLTLSLPQGRDVVARPGETVLDACRRTAFALPFSCCAGVCQTCLLKATSGAVAPEAQKGLSPELRERNYLLACQCVPAGPMKLEWPDPADRRTDALLIEAQRAGPYVHVRLETARTLPCQPGQRLMLTVPGETTGESVLEVTGVFEGECAIEALCEANAPAAAVLERGEFGQSLQVRGPVNPSRAGAPELPAPTPDPALWEELGQGAVVREVLEDFYARVYQDPRLARFFEGVTMGRSIDKQYSFLKQLLTGERVYFGDRPRNAHHWMVISDELFDYRQALMVETLAAHGLSPTQIARWTRVELHFRADMVKDAAWPRVVGGVELPLDGYARETLTEATVCDHCGDAVEAGTTVNYHLRLGKVSCPQCTGEAALERA